MTTKTLKARCLLSLFVVVGMVLTNSWCLTSVEASAPVRKLNRTAEMKRAVKVSVLLEPGKRASQERVPVIVELVGRSSGQLNAFLQRNDVRLGRKMEMLNTFSLTLPFSMVAELASFPEVLHVSVNEVVTATGHVTSTTGADAARLGASNAGYGSIDGSGIGIAILDSGIDLNHAQFSSSGSGSRVLASVDFTGENRVDDPYGHGTYVAAAAAGSTDAGSEYVGIAPKASLLNVRVLGSNGQGTVESVLAGLDWVAVNARQYNIRIVNLSLGMRAVESYKHDVLCRSVRGLTNSGILIVAAAGNDGKDHLTQKVFGSIHSPGNEPSAFTIGATNTFQTDGRSDDNVASFSSNGPTRSYWVDTTGIRHHDNLLKPDLVAPGNKLIFAEARDNHLVTLNPTLHASAPLVEPSMRMMRMSGTSVSTPIVAGAAALLFQINPKMSPNMVKAFLQYTAQKLDGVGVLEQGAGQLNIEGAMRLAELVRQDLNSPVQVGMPLLTGPPPNSSTFGGNSFAWSATIVRKFNTVTGTSLVTRLQGPYCTGELLGDGFLLSDGLIINQGQLFAGGARITDGESLWTNGAFVADGVLVSADPLMTDAVVRSSQTITFDGSISSDPLMKGAGSVSAAGDYDGILRSAGIVLSTGETLSAGAFIGQGQLVGDGILIGNGELVANGITISDSIVVSDGIIFTDRTVFGDGIIFADGIIVADGIIFADGIIVADGIIFTDGITFGD